MKIFLHFFTFLNVNLGYFNSHHDETKLLYTLSIVCYKDSGLWDFCMTKMFDLVFRLYFIYTLLPLTEHGWCERAITNLLVITHNFNFYFTKKETKLFDLFLENILSSLFFIFIIFFLVLMF